MPVAKGVVRGAAPGQSLMKYQTVSRLPQRLFRAIVIGVGSLLTVWYFIKL